MECPFLVADVEEKSGNNNEFATPIVLICDGGESTASCLEMFVNTFLMLYL